MFTRKLQVQQTEKHRISSQQRSENRTYKRKSETLQKLKVEKVCSEPGELVVLYLLEGYVNIEVYV